MIAPASDRSRTIPLRPVGEFVDRRASSLQARSQGHDPRAVAALARLRRGVGLAPGELPDLLAYTHDDSFVDGDAPSREEIAVHAALTLHALHQQSRSDPMHVRGRGLGTALRSLDTDNSLPDALVRRFRMLGTSDGIDELNHHLRGAVQLLRQGMRSLDYGRLADQLVGWQTVEGPARVRLEWGREFYRTSNTVAAETPNEGTDQ